MNQKVYDVMDWGRIEALVYSEENQPHEILGATVTDDGILVQTFLPDAERVCVQVKGGDAYEMDMEDETGFFAVLIPGNEIFDYTFEADFKDGAHYSIQDPYNYEPQIPEKVLKKFAAGICYDIYEYLGAHEMTVNGVKGLYFAVWAPNAVRVSVVGDYNLWDGRRSPMRKLEKYGIFELFLPGLEKGMLYKYEIKAKHGLTYLKSDPFAFETELAPADASVAAGKSSYKWEDSEWMSWRETARFKGLPMSVCQLSLSSWKKFGGSDTPLSYSQLASELISYVKKMGYTHVEFMPVMEYSDESSMGYATTAFYAPTKRYGKPDELRYLIDQLHQNSIGVIFDWAAGHFPRDVHGLIGFDGTNLYESGDARKSYYAPDGGLYFDLGRKEVSNYLIANALFWAREYHVDALRAEDISKLLYLDYDKKPGEWVSNMYGGNENLEAVEFFKHLNSIFHQMTGGALMIAEDTSSWPMVTGSVEDGALGFDLKWNHGFRDSLMEYIQLDPIFRGPHHAELIFSMVYHYSENFMLAVSCGDNMDTSMYARVPGRRKNKLANLRAAYGYIMMHPGKKLLAMGCDIAQKAPLSQEGVDWSALDHEENEQFSLYMADLLKFYREQAALYALDYDPEGFEWINNISANENMLVFLRKSSIEEQNLLIVVNFSALAYADHKIGVPYAGKYKEIFNSDAPKYGGDGNINPRVKKSKADECDELPNSIRVTVPPMGISVFSCTRVEEEEVKKAPAAKTRKTSGRAKKTSAASAKKTGSKTTKSLKEKLEKKVNEEEYK